MKRNQDNLNCKMKYNRISAACRLAMRRYECWLESRVIDCNILGLSTNLSLPNHPAAPMLAH